MGLPTYEKLNRAAVALCNGDARVLVLFNNGESVQLPVDTTPGFMDALDGAIRREQDKVLHDEALRLRNRAAEIDAMRKELKKKENG